MKLYAFAVACTLLLSPASFAHGTAPAAAHGGQVAEDSADHWVELVVSGQQLTVYVLDQGQKPVTSAQLAGKVTVLVGGKSEVVALTPGDANSLTGKLASGATGKVTAVLSLTVSGKTAQARFSLAL